jgi:pantothenate kinase-related protein Tda10
MSLLKEAIANDAGAAKMAWFGPQGSGKTMAATQVAVGLSHHYHKDAPIAFFDTEKGSDFAKTLCIS